MSNTPHPHKGLTRALRFPRVADVAQIEYLTTREVAELAKVHPTTVGRWAKDGEVPFVRLPGGQLRFKRTDVDQLLQPTEVAS